MNEEWEFKMVAANEDYENRLMEADRQKEYHQLKCLEYEQQIHKLNENIATMEI